jgi:succinoglycan biosynthesis protein ExoM
VSLCSYMRPALLTRCLEQLLEQDTSFPFEIIVVDNDCGRSAERIVMSFQEKAESRNIPLRYFVEPEQNIALARNLGVAQCSGKFVAFIDDDEYPDRQWLGKLHEALGVYRVTGVFGPVIPIVPGRFPSWLLKSGVFDGLRMRTGTSLAPRYLRTSNAMVDAAVLTRLPGPFDERLGRTGGEDSMLFRQLCDLGYRFCWCDEAIVSEVQEEQRSRALWHFARNYRGGWCYSRDRCLKYGLLRAAPLVLAIGIAGLLRSTVGSMRNIFTPRVSSFLLARGIAGFLGKCGYFVGMRIEVYRRRPPP